MRGMSIVASMFALATAAFAGPYGTGTGGGRCPTAIGNKTYACTATAASGDGVSDCLRFASGSGGVFSAVSDRLKSTLGCSCNPIGKAGQVAFGASATFTCTAPDGLSLSGRVKKGGGLAQVSATNVAGGSYALTCQPLDSCSVE